MGRFGLSHLLVPPHLPLRLLPLLINAILLIDSSLLLAQKCWSAKLLIGHIDPFSVKLS